MKFELSEIELRRAKEWMEYHSKIHELKSEGAIGGRWTYEVTPTSIGILCRVRCFCGASAQIDDECHPEEMLPGFPPMGIRECGGRTCGFWTDENNRCDPCGQPKDK